VEFLIVDLAGIGQKTERASIFKVHGSLEEDAAQTASA